MLLGRAIHTHRTRLRRAIATRLVEFECVRLDACSHRCLYRICILIAPTSSGDLLAQLVEHRIPENLENKFKRILPKVGGSNPP